MWLPASAVPFWTASLLKSYAAVVFLLHTTQYGVALQSQPATLIGAHYFGGWYQCPRVLVMFSRGRILHMINSCMLFYFLALINLDYRSKNSCTCTCLLCAISQTCSTNLEIIFSCAVIDVQQSTEYGPNEKCWKKWRHAATYLSLFKSKLLQPLSRIFSLRNSNRQLDGILSGENSFAGKFDCRWKYHMCGDHCSG